LPFVKTSGNLSLTVAYPLSFSSEFFFSTKPQLGTDRDTPCDRPTTVEQALQNLSEKTWEKLARTVFHCEPQFLDIDTVVRMVVESNTCRNFDPPVEVYIDPEREFSVLVYDGNESGLDHFPHRV
jgi:hypothetical protein